MELERADLHKSVKDIYSKIEASYNAYESFASINEDEYGYDVDFDGRIPADESELDSNKIYLCQFFMYTSSPIV